MIQNIRYIILFTVLLGGCTAINHHPNSQPKLIDQQSAKLISALQEGVSIYFDTGSSSINTKYHLYFQTAAQMLAEQPNLVIVLEGYTDNVGLKGVNKRISFERANAVKQKLIEEYKVNAEQIKAVGLGSIHPVADNSTAEGRAYNRRVMAKIYVN